MNLNELIKSFDNLPKIVKLILAIPALDIICIIMKDTVWWF